MNESCSCSFMLIEHDSGSFSVANLVVYGFLPANVVRQTFKNALFFAFIF